MAGRLLAVSPAGDRNAAKYLRGGKREMKRVLQINYTLECGGEQAFLTNLNGCRDVFREPFDFLVTREGRGKDFYEQPNLYFGSKIYGIKGDFAATILPDCIQRIVLIYRFLRKHHYDIVHIHGSSNFLMPIAFLAKTAGIPAVFVHSHNTRLSYRGWQRFPRKMFHMFLKPFWRIFADECCACSVQAGIHMFGRRAVRAGKVHILKNGIQAQRYSFNPRIRENYRKAYGLEGKFVIGHVGRFAKQKNHEFLIAVFAELVLSEPDAELLLFGEGEQENRIAGQVKKLGLQDKVRFFGVSPEVAEWMQAMDVFVLPSLYEGLPVVGIEAQAAGLPLIVSDTVTEELKLLDTTEFLSLDAAPSVWAESILRYRRHRRKNTEETVRKAGYDIETTARVLAALYEGKAAGGSVLSQD